MGGATDYFSPVAAFISLRETLEAGIIIAVLLGFVDQIIPFSPQQGHEQQGSSTHLLSQGQEDTDSSGNRRYSTFSRTAPNINPQLLSPNVRPRNLDDDDLSDISSIDGDEACSGYDRDTIVRTLKAQVWSGALTGLAAASIVGAIFLYIFYRFAHDLWQDAENLWEGIFCGIAALIILVMGLAFLRLPMAQTKWRLKLISAVEGKAAGVTGDARKRKARARAARGFILFGLPFITVLREGLEGVVFLGGIGITDSPRAIITGALTGFIVGGLIAWYLFTSAERMSLRAFTTASTMLLFMMGAGLASRSAYSLERQYFINGVGTQVAEAGDGPGSYRVKGNIWKLKGASPEPGHEGYSGFWQLAQSLVGWNNIGTWWTCGTYMAYWWFIIAVLVRMKWKEGRTAICGHLSPRGYELEKRRRRAIRLEGEEEGLLPAVEDANGAGGSGSRPSEEELPVQSQSQQA